MSIALLVAVLGVYTPGLGGIFLFDDIEAIVNNRAIQVEGLSGDELRRALLSFGPGNGGWQARPLAMLSFALNHTLGGLDPSGYKLVGVLVHAVNTLLIWRLLCLVLPHVLQPGDDRAGRLSPHLLAAVMAAFWAINPQQVSSVLYVVQRMETLCYTFVILGLWAYLRARLAQQQGARAWHLLFLVAVSGVFALGFKETVVLLPLYALALEIFVLGFSAASPRIQAFWRWGYGVGAGVGVLLFALVIVPHYWVDELVYRDFGTAERLLTQLRVLPMYLGQILLPLPNSLPFYYDQIIPSRGWLEPLTTLWGGLLLLTLLVSAVLLRKRLPLYGLGVAWFFVGHALTSNVVPLELAFEHRNYFALLGVVMAVAAVLGGLRPLGSPVMAHLVWGCVLIVTAGLCLMRSLVWGDGLLLAEQNVHANPLSARASMDLAYQYYRRSAGSIDSPLLGMAVTEMERGATLPNAGITGDQGLLLIYAKFGLPGADAVWDRLINKLKVQAISPETLGALHGLLRNRISGVALDDRCLTDAFLVVFERGEMLPVHYAQFGDYLLRHAGEPDQASKSFANAVLLSLAAGDETYARQVITILVEDGHMEQARYALSQAHQRGALKDVLLK
ncbi:hypothetical protein ABXT00_13980 [Stenotrophomonas koreensis]|uniref:hypothetical protein n=1 Tax=Stenotrophomonas koreensis TaxID=266128 RepID=UPI00339740FC